MRKTIVLLAWYFAITGGTIGPFDNESKCNEIRELFARSPGVRSTCWYFGGSNEPKPIPR